MLSGCYLLPPCSLAGQLDVDRCQPCLPSTSVFQPPSASVSPVPRLSLSFTPPSFELNDDDARCDASRSSGVDGRGKCSSGRMAQGNVLSERTFLLGFEFVEELNGPTCRATLDQLTSTLTRLCRRYTSSPSAGGGVSGSPTCSFFRVKFF